MSWSLQIPDPPTELADAAGFIRSGQLWIVPGGDGVLSQEDVVGALDRGEFPGDLDGCLTRSLLEGGGR